MVLTNIKALRGHIKGSVLTIDTIPVDDWPRPRNLHMDYDGATYHVRLEWLENPVQLSAKN